jgi:hypothetical protein
MTYDVSMTVAEFEKLPDDGNLHELDEGELIFMPPATLRHGMVQAEVLAESGQAARQAGSGIVLGRCGLVQAPDVATANSPPILRLRFCLQTTMQPDCSGRLAGISRQAPASCGFWTPIRSLSPSIRGKAHSER